MWVSEFPLSQSWQNCTETGKFYILNLLTCIKSLLSGDNHQSQRARSSDLSMLPSRIIESGRRKDQKTNQKLNAVLMIILHPKKNNPNKNNHHDCLRLPQRNYLFSTFFLIHVESVSPLESTSGMDLREDESSKCFTSRYVDWDETNFTSLTMMSSTKMLYWLQGQKKLLNQH